MNSTTAIWALTAALLTLAVVIAIVGYTWATTSNLDRLTDEDVLAMLARDDEWTWPQLDDAERNARHDYQPDDDKPTALELAAENSLVMLPPEGRAA